MKCEIIQDLLPLYCDGLASDATREEVERHVESCGVCRERLGQMKAAVPEIETPDIIPMKKVRRKLRIRLALVIGMVCIGVITGLIGIIRARQLNPSPISSEKLSYEYSSRLKDQLDYIYGNHVFSFPAGSNPVIDRENDCVLLNGEKVKFGSVNGVTQYLPGDGELHPGGVLSITVECDSKYNYMKVEENRNIERIDYFNNTVPVNKEITFKPCSSRIQISENETEYAVYTEDGLKYYQVDCVEAAPYIIEFEAAQCGEGASLTIHCRDRDVEIDLHELALEEGLLEE